MRSTMGNLPPVFILSADIILPALDAPQEICKKITTSWNFDDVRRRRPVVRQKHRISSLPLSSGRQKAAREIFDFLRGSGEEILTLSSTWTHIRTKLGSSLCSELSKDLNFATRSIYKFSNPSSELPENLSIRTQELWVAIALAKQSGRRHIILVVQKELFETLDQYPEAIKNNVVAIWDLEDFRNHVDYESIDNEGNDLGGDEPLPPDHGGNNGDSPSDNGAADTEEAVPPAAAAYAYGMDSRHTHNPLGQFFTTLGLFLAPLLFNRFSGKNRTTSQDEPPSIGSATFPHNSAAPEPNTAHQDHRPASPSQTASSVTPHSVPLVAGGGEQAQTSVPTREATQDIAINPVSETLPAITLGTVQLNLVSGAGIQLLPSITPWLRTADDLRLSANPMAESSHSIAISSLDANQPQFLVKPWPNTLSSTSSEQSMALKLPDELRFDGFWLSQYAYRRSLFLDQPQSSGDRPGKIPPPTDPAIPSVIPDLAPTILPDNPPPTIPVAIPPTIPSEQPDSRFNSGVFTVGTSGVIGVNFLFDGGGYAGELGIFSLRGMGQYDLQSTDFIQEAIRRVTSDSSLGHVIISDVTQAARFSESLPWEMNVNQGDYLGRQTFAMQPGDQFGFVLLPNGSFDRLSSNIHMGEFGTSTSELIFSLTPSQPNPLFASSPIADTGLPHVYAIEDLVQARSDRDYNDLIFQLDGATGTSIALDTVIAPQVDWRSTDLGNDMVAFTNTDVPPTGTPTTTPQTTGNPDHDAHRWAMDSYSWQYQEATISYPSGNSASNSYVLNSSKSSGLNQVSREQQSSLPNTTLAPCECNSSPLYSGNVENPFIHPSSKPDVLSHGDDPFHQSP
jgi:hypothetical protein